MTITNQAFIKAYRHDAAQAAPASPAIAGSAGPASVGANRSVESVSAATGERSALYGPRPASTPSLDARAPHAARTLEKRPLSSFIDRPHKGTLDAPSVDAEFLRPGTTIASFQWPSVCRALAQRCGGELDSVAQLLMREAEAGRSLIGVLGLFPGRGTTTTALCLAERLAAKRRVILVDGNFRSPRLATWLEAVPTTGWQDVLKHGGPLSDAVVRAQDNRLDLLALDARQPANAARLIGGLQAVVTAGVLRHTYEVVLVDLGAFSDSSTPPIALEVVRNMALDSVLIIAGPEPPDDRDLDNVAAQLARSGCELLGTIENRVAKPPAA